MADDQEEYDGLTAQEIKDKITINGKAKWDTASVTAYLKTQGESPVDIEFAYKNASETFEIYCKNGTKCAGDGTYTINWNNYISHNRRCSSCGQAVSKDWKRITPTEIIEMLKGYKFTLLSEYKNNKTPVKVKCDVCKNEDTVTLASIKKRIKPCKFCN
jgi:hypothetical protein